MKKRMPWNQYSPFAYAVILRKRYGGGADLIASDRMGRTENPTASLFYERVQVALEQISDSGEIRKDNPSTEKGI